MELTNIEKFFSDRITIWRLEQGDLDKYGSYDKTWIKKLWDIKCRLYPYRGNSEFLVPVDGIERRITHKIMCNRNVDVQVGDKIENANFNETYIVILVSRVRGMRDISHLEVSVALTEGVSQT